MGQFCHLHLHNQYSILDGIGTSAQYAEAAKEIGQKYIGLTNHGNIDGVIAHQKECLKAGVTPLLGCELYVVDDLRQKVKKETRYHLTVLVENQTGWNNLLKILTIANVEGFYYRPRIDLQTLENHLEGLVVMTGCSMSFLNMEGGRSFLRNIISKIGKERLFLEVMPHIYDQQIKLNVESKKLAKEFGIKIVATNDCHYPFEKSAFYQEILLAIQTKKKLTDKDRWKFTVTGLYLKSYDEMFDAFKEQGVFDDDEIESYLENTIDVAKICQDFKIQEKIPNLPTVGTEGDESDYQALRRLVIKGKEKLLGHLTEEEVSEYNKRASQELRLITKMKFERYFLSVWDLINWCKVNDVMTGPGRGSVGGSLVAYLLGITAVDPIKYDLTFSRFISPARIDLPDIDMDFEDHKRYRVREYLEQKYGKYNVVGLSTFTTMKGKGILRDVSRVYDIPLKEVNIAAKAIDDTADKGCQISKSFSDIPECVRFKKRYPEVVDVAGGLEGQIRGCVSGDCRLILSKKDGRIRVKKIKHLYKEKYRGKARSFDLSKNILFFDDIVDIWQSGIKKVYDLKVNQKGVGIRLTSDHLLLTKEGWKEAHSIKTGEAIAVNGKQIAWNKGLTKDDHAGVMVHSKRMKKDNPARLDHVKKQVSKRSFKHGLYCLVNKYRESHPICEVCGVSETEEIHHLDKNREHNEDSNLLAVCKGCHREFHREAWRNLDIGKINPLQTVAYSKVVSFEYVGEEMTYDIEMKSGNHNFVCNKIIAHNCGQHAAAVCISSADLRSGENCNIAIRSGQSVANWDKENAEFMGLVKLDILGLSALSVLNETKVMVKKNHGVDINFYDNLLDDPDVYYQINKGSTAGAFQIGAAGLSKFCRKLGVDSFDMLSAATALFRPGPLHSGMAEQFIKIKNKKQKIRLIHPIYDEITKKTLSIIVYQEQVMAVINQLSGIDMATCDKIRKLMAKSKGADALNKYKERFLSGCIEKDTVKGKLALEIWDTISTFGKYGFNKAHSVAYSMISYWDMWLKTYYPAEFLACCFTFGKRDQVNEYLREANRLKLDVRLPKMGVSHSTNWIADNEKNLFAPFIAINGIGETSAKKIASFEYKEKKCTGFFKSLPTSNTQKIPGVNKTVTVILEEIDAFSPLKEITMDEKRLIRKILGSK